MSANGPSPSGEALLSVRDLRVHFPVYGGVLSHRVGLVKAVDGVSFDLGKGETLGLVGESGCGKTTTGKAIANLIRPLLPDVEVSGHARLDGTDLLSLTKARMRLWRSKVQMIFQDPYASLNPRLTVGRIVEEPLRNHTPLSRAERLSRVKELLEQVGLKGAHAARYPHEFSGGQRQRIGIARAMATHPELMIADEPVSALDVSVQAQVVNLLQDLQERLGLSYLFIAHDLSVVRHISSRVAVMYLGHIVEIGPAKAICDRPVHPYARALLSAVPRPDPEKRRAGRIVLAGDPPSPARKPSGCPFRTRCPIAKHACAETMPPLSEVDGRLVACPYAGEMK